MKTLAILLAAILSTLSLSPACARSPYLPTFKDLYYKSGGKEFQAAVDDVKCNVCHQGNAKQNRNEYGKAVNKILTRAEFDRLRLDAPALAQFAKEAMQKTESEKNSAGKSFGDLIKAGELPGGK